MKRFVSAAILAAGVGVGAASAQADSGSAPERSPGLEPGARGTVLTTLQGRTPTEIPVRYLGTYRDYAGPGLDVYLVELEGPAAERVGAAHGMSGSPVYFDGRLVGALAYRFGAFAKEPIAGVTPIEDMLDASRRPGAADGSDDGLRPIGTPVYLGGLDPAARAWLAPRLEARGFVAVAGGSAAAGVRVGETLVPGAPIGVELVRGDLSVAASGTVTRVDDDVVYAFGHPFFGSGPAEMPMATAEVVHTLADWSGSYHMVNLGPSVGAIVEDRRSAIIGRLGRVARMIPMDLRVRGGDYGDRDFHLEVVAKSELTPLLTAVAASNALYQSNGHADKTTVQARGRLRLRELPEIPVEMAFSSSQGRDPGLAVAERLFGLLRGLWDNPFAEVGVEGIDLTIEVRSEPVSYRVESLHYDRGRLRPGEVLKIRCVLREHRGEIVTHELSLPLPEQLPRRGSLTLAVSSPAGVDAALGNPLARRLRSARDLRAVVDTLGDLRSAHRLTAVVYTKGGAVVTRGRAFAELPPTVERLLSLEAPAAAGKGRPLVSPLARAELELDGPVEGGRQVRLKIERGFATEGTR